MSTVLSQYYITKARDELGEDDNRKRDLLKRFNEVLEKHSFIKNYKPDEIFILMFLRSQKYALNSALKKLEDILTFIESHRSWYDCSEENLAKIYNLIDAGYLTISQGFHSNGSKIVFIKAIDFNFETEDYIRTVVFSPFACALEEETQIAGLIYLFDVRECSFQLFHKHFSPFVNEFMTKAKNLPFRMKKCILLGFPNYIASFMKIIRALLTEKIRNRIVIVDTIEELSEHLGESNLIEEYGGKVRQTDNAQYTKEIMTKNIEILKRNLIYNIELKRDNESIDFGNFRKLNID